MVNVPVTRPEPGDRAGPDLATCGSLKRQVALVTGANRGIGSEIDHTLAERGATVFAGVRSVIKDTSAYLRLQAEVKRTQ